MAEPKYQVGETICWRHEGVGEVQQAPVLAIDLSLADPAYKVKFRWQSPSHVATVDTEATIPESWTVSPEQATVEAMMGDNRPNRRRGLF